MDFGTIHIQKIYPEQNSCRRLSKASPQINIDVFGALFKLRLSIVYVNVYLMTPIMACLKQGTSWISEVKTSIIKVTFIVIFP